MGQIQSSVGLLSGFPIQDTVDKLIQVASQPKNNLSDRTKLLQGEQSADQQLSALLLAFQFEVKQLGTDSLFQSKQATSTNTAGLAATIPNKGNPAVGNFLDACALTVPCHEPGTPPVGLMIMGGALADRRILAIGRSCEALFHANP